MKAAFYTLGCKVNQYESEYMAELLRSAGFEIVSPDQELLYGNRHCGPKDPPKRAPL